MEIHYTSMDCIRALQQAYRRELPRMLAELDAMQFEKWMERYKELVSLQTA